jgi:hypothetical protein
MSGNPILTMYSITGRAGNVKGFKLPRMTDLGKFETGKCRVKGEAREWVGECLILGAINF